MSGFHNYFDNPQERQQLEEDRRRIVGEDGAPHRSQRNDQYQDFAYGAFNRWVHERQYRGSLPQYDGAPLGWRPEGPGGVQRDWRWGPR